MLVYIHAHALYNKQDAHLQEQGPQQSLLKAR